MVHVPWNNVCCFYHRSILQMSPLNPILNKWYNVVVRGEKQWGVTRVRGWKWKLWHLILQVHLVRRCVVQLLSHSTSTNATANAYLHTLQQKHNSARTHGQVNWPVSRVFHQFNAIFKLHNTVYYVWTFVNRNRARQQRIIWATVLNGCNCPFLVLTSKVAASNTFILKQRSCLIVCSCVPLSLFS